MSTSPGGTDLPAMSAELASSFAEPPPPPDWSDPYEGSIPFVEAGVRALVARIVDRTANIEATMTNRWILDSGDGEPMRPQLGEVRASTLVLHETEDPLFPIAHGEALAAEIPGARLLPLEGMGHEVPPRPLWDQVVAAILEHTAEGGRDQAET